MWKEFKEFAIKGNAIELAIGVIIGAAFQPIVTSLVNDVMMPPIGMLAGKVDFKDKYVALDGKEYETLDIARKQSAPVIGYGQFINTVVNFFVVAFCVFLVVKAMNEMRRNEKNEPAAPAAPTTQEKLLMEIRDSLQRR